MSNILLSMKKIWKKAAILCAVGIVFSIIVKMTFGSANGMFLTDMLFAIGSVFFLFGLGGLVKNLGTFNSLKYGAKCLVRIFRGKQEPSGKMKEDYIEYVKSRPKSRDALWVTAFSFVFFVLSLLASLPML